MTYPPYTSSFITELKPQDDSGTDWFSIDSTRETVILPERKVLRASMLALEQDHPYGWLYSTKAGTIAAFMYGKTKERLVSPYIWLLTGLQSVYAPSGSSGLHPDRVGYFLLFILDLTNDVTLKLPEKHRSWMFEVEAMRPVYDRANIDAYNTAIARLSSAAIAGTNMHVAAQQRIDQAQRMKELKEIALPQTYHTTL